MLTRILGRGMRIEVAGQEHVFRSLAELDQLLRSRIQPSHRRAGAVGQLDDSALARQSEVLRNLHARLGQALAHTTPDGAVAFLATLEASDISEEHQWRSIIIALHGGGTEAAPFLDAALRRYHQYLGACLGLLQHERTNRVVIGAAPPKPGEAPVKPRQRLMLMLEDGLGGGAALGEPERLPRGEPVDIAIQPHQSLPLMLARHRFILVAGDPFLLVDDSGHDVKVGPGRKVVGRSAEADIHVDPLYRSVSRQHLLLETGSGRLRLTDTSTLGTFMWPDRGRQPLH